jgi:hypothetical protein
MNICTGDSTKWSEKIELIVMVYYLNCMIHYETKNHLVFVSVPIEMEEIFK